MTGVQTCALPILRAGYYPIFLHTLFAGLVPPFSHFLMAILDTYQIQLLHLHPNSILILSIFAYLCEAYIGVRPSVDLFRSIYALRLTAGNEWTGSVSFRINDSMSKIYIPIMWQGENAVTKVTKKVDGFRKRWLFVDAKVTSAFLERSEERRVGKECSEPCRSRWSPYH